MAGLLPTIIILAAYVRFYHNVTSPRDSLMSDLQYIACDTVILSQIYYYRWLKSKRTVPPEVVSEPLEAGHVPSEDTPLLSGSSNTLEKQTTSALRQFLKYGLMLSFIMGTGVAAWAIDEHIHKGQPRTPPEEVLEWKSQLLGWISAVLYSE